MQGPDCFHEIPQVAPLSSLRNEVNLIAPTVEKEMS